MSALAAYLIAGSAAIPLALGALHLLYTFRGPKLLPRDPALRARMAEVPLVLTRETTVWRAWIGFNASHGVGAMLFGSVYGYLALARPTVLLGSPFLLGVGLVVLLVYAVLARRYWFRIPFAGIVASLLLYASALAAALA